MFAHHKRNWHICFLQKYQVDCKVEIHKKREVDSKELLKMIIDCDSYLLRNQVDQSVTVIRTDSTFVSQFIYFFQSTNMNPLTTNQEFQQEEQIMIMIGQWDDMEDNPNPDLLDLLTAEPTTIKKSSQHYDYEPASVPIPQEDIEDTQTIGLKTSNRSTSTCGDSEPVVAVRRCMCSKTRCLKNYCECFKQGMACTSECSCISCCNKEKLFLERVNPHTIKCKCQKSHCLKKYCECHSTGRKCGPHCKCSECENMEQQQPMDCEFTAVKMENQVDQFDHLIFFNI